MAHKAFIAVHIQLETTKQSEKANLIFTFCSLSYHFETLHITMLATLSLFFIMMPL